MVFGAADPTPPILDGLPVVLPAFALIVFIIITTPLYTLLFRGTRGSVLLAMVFHTGWNLAPEFAWSSFVGAELQHAFTLYMAGGIAVAALAIALGWRRLAPTPAAETGVRVAAPAGL